MVDLSWAQKQPRLLDFLTKKKTKAYFQIEIMKLEKQEQKHDKHKQESIKVLLQKRNKTKL